MDSCGWTTGQYHPRTSSCFWVSETFDKWDRLTLDFAVKPSDAFNVDELLSLIAFEPLLRPLLNGALQVSQSPDLVILPVLQTWFD